MIRSLMILAGACFGAPVLAQEGPSFDCAAAETTAEELVCGDADLAALDRLVAERYAAALEVVQNQEAGAVEAADTLRASQRGWIGGRDECWKSDDPRACVEWEYQRREGDLVAKYMLEEPTGTAFFQCGESPANELVAMFFDTVLPSARLERGDRASTASLARAASGSRYDGDFGEYLWIHGEEATYREPDPDGTEHDCVQVN